MNFEEESISFEIYEGLWDFIVHVGNKEVGKAELTLKDEHRLEINDIKIDDKLPVSTFWSRHFGFKPRFINYRRYHLGSKLLTRVIAEAETAGIVEIYGHVVRKDLAERPWLLEWYQGYGFEVHLPDECYKGDAVKKIVKRITSTLSKG